MSGFEVTVYKTFPCFAFLKKSLLIENLQLYFATLRPKLQQFPMKVFNNFVYKINTLGSKNFSEKLKLFAIELSVQKTFFIEI